MVIRHWANSEREKPAATTTWAALFDMHQHTHRIAHISLCCTNHGTLTDMRNSSMGPS